LVEVSVPWGSVNVQIFDARPIMIANTVGKEEMKKEQKYVM
jgi:hypothetical protein